MTPEREGRLPALVKLGYADLVNASGDKKYTKKLRGVTFSRRMVAVFLAACGFYFVVPPAATIVFPRLRGEIYPLSMWSMFYRVHNRVDDFGLRIVGGKPNKGALYFEDSGLSRSHSIAGYHAIQKLGRQVKAQNAAGVSRARKTVEKAYLKASVDYEIVERSWDPYERFKQGTFLKEQVLWHSNSTAKEGNP